FRRHFPYQEVPRAPAAWAPALDMLRDSPEVREVILSGGDPLTESDQRLAGLWHELERITHVQTLRIHTRLPIFIPRRVTDALLNRLATSRFRVVIVIHANHARELDGEVVESLVRLRAAGALLLNQSVLLHGVNDSVAALVDLSDRLLACGVLPYYLHQLDRVHGAAHFEVTEERGRQLIEAMRIRLPGYAVPRYVREIAGQPHKTVLE
ncbi:MAG: KamA family radical SAM protein, partial [Planctomycetales bacterium]|nr:KamA family radical SAM protein [Planctomycetales bacterium]